MSIGKLHLFPNSSMFPNGSYILFETKCPAVVWASYLMKTAAVLAVAIETCSCCPGCTASFINAEYEKKKKRYSPEVFVF